MILFLGDSFTWGQGLYYEKWEKEGINVNRWIEKNGRVFEYPHENLDYQSHQYRKENHFPSLVARHYDKNYDVRWGNGGSNWDIIVQINMIPVFAPQFRDGLDLVVIQLTDWTRPDNQDFFIRDLFKNSIVNTDFLSRDKKWEDTLVDNLFENEALYQLNKINEYLSNLDKKWIAFSWLDDMGKLLKDHFPENYTPIFIEDEEYCSFEKVVSNSKYILDRFEDGHFNSKGHHLISNSIIKKIDSMGGNEIFKYPKYSNEIFINKQVI